MFPNRTIEPSQQYSHLAYIPWYPWCINYWEQSINQQLTSSRPELVEESRWWHLDERIHQRQVRVTDMVAAGKETAAAWPLEGFCFTLLHGMKVWTMLSSLKLDKIALFFSTIFQQTNSVFLSQQISISQISTKPRCIKLTKQSSNNLLAAKQCRGSGR
jgi:hypothetical protein